MSFLHKIEFFGAVILGFWWLANAAVSYDRWSQRRLKCKNRDPRLGDCDSWIERRLYNAFLRLGYEPICQKKVGPYCIDLALMINGQKVAIECDGREFHSYPDQIARDRRRTQYLRACGWTVMRFSGSQINRNATQCAVQVLRSMGIRQSRVITPQYE